MRLQHNPEPIKVLPSVETDEYRCPYCTNIFTKGDDHDFLTCEKAVSPKPLATMTHDEKKAALLGRIGTVEWIVGDRPTGMRVAVRVLDVTNAYGNTRLVVEPVVGEGKATVDMKRVKF